jgi:hypothetical protein
MGCALGTRWHQPSQQCIQEDENPFVTKDLGNGLIIRCYTQGMISHPTDRYKYVICEYISDGSNKGWHINIMNCAPGTRWYQPTQNCIRDDEPATHSPITQPPVTPSSTTAVPVTPSQTTQSHVISTERPTGDPYVTGTVDGHTVRCYKSGYIPHPTDRHKFIFCEYLDKGPKQGWWIHIMDCGPGTRWHQPTENCIAEGSI